MAKASKAPDDVITSSHNPKIQKIRSLMSRRKGRQRVQAFVIEGVRLAEEALHSGWQPHYVVYSEQLSERGKKLLDNFSRAGVDIDEVSPQLMESIAETEAPQGLLAIFDQRNLPLPEHLDFDYHVAQHGPFVKLVGEIHVFVQPDF